MDELHGQRMTPFDQMISDDGLQILKASIPYVPTRMQGMLSIFAKVKELQNVLSFSRRLPSMHMASQEGHGSMMEMFQDIGQYTNGSMKGTFDNLNSMLSMMQMFQSFQNSDAGGMDFSNMSNMNPGNMNSTNMSNTNPENMDFGNTMNTDFSNFNFSDMEFPDMNVPNMDIPNIDKQEMDAQDKDVQDIMDSFMSGKESEQEQQQFSQEEEDINYE